MATAIPMPALSPTMKEGKITRWLKKEGDKISSGEAIAECETDKSNLEIEAYEDGFLVKVLVKEGESAPVGAPIGFIGEKGEKVDASASAPAKAEAPKAASTPAPTPKAAPPPAPARASSSSQGQVVPLRPAPEPSNGDRLRASPLARKMAETQGLDLAALQGSGPQGRIIKRDIEQAVASGGSGRVGAAAAKLAPPPGAPFGAAAFERREPQVLAMSSMRKVIAQRMAEVKPGVPHFYLTVEVDMGAALAIREEAKALESKVSVNDIIVKAAGVALRQLPKMNVSLQGDRILQFGNADVGVAVSIEDGLITPVVRDADLKGLGVISAEVRDLAERARRKALKPQEYTGGALTVSNLGMYGIDSFIAVINPPQAAIIAVGAVAERPVVHEGSVTVRKMMSATLSGDHRVIDGALGAQYLKLFKSLLEHPMRLLF
jgi:pyruvate dehydrogenase E2 component (dihydrolipoamide acetyltransferase)